MSKNLDYAALSIFVSPQYSEYSLSSFLLQLPIFLLFYAISSGSCGVCVLFCFVAFFFSSRFYCVAALVFFMQVLIISTRRGGATFEQVWRKE